MLRFSAALYSTMWYSLPGVPALLPNQPTGIRNARWPRTSRHSGPLSTTTLQLMPRRPRLVTASQRRGQRTPRSHWPVPQNSSAVSRPASRATFSATSTTQ
ncbi:hypothetical protein BDY21DRAFT_348463 [Lineolata rhizophorae]|uniref:Uncharacterized protein n=1 Tax=Lineolata rhizophorae TaxID=578093 RepID=A0A6A6NX19_9PEZI|nr:hypothetical protein BDY21DRAFT_348463 [Lineolata rhizophorae]